MPLYFRPVNTMITAEQVKDLRRIDGIWFYTRILFPDDEEFMIDSAKPIDAAAV